MPRIGRGKPAAMRLGIVVTPTDLCERDPINGSTNQRNCAAYTIPAGVLVRAERDCGAHFQRDGRGGFVPVLSPHWRHPLGAGVTGPALTAWSSPAGLNVTLAGDWRAKIEEAWEGARRRDILPSVSIAQNSAREQPVAGCSTRPAPGPPPARRGTIDRRRGT